MLTIIITCLILAAMSIARSGLFIHTWRHSQSIFKKTAPYGFFGVESWVRKYKGGILLTDQILPYLVYPVTRIWYHKFFGLKYQERFLFSATALVFLTDFFHLTQFITLTLIAVAITYAADQPWYTILIYKAIMSSTFQMFFGKLFKYDFWHK